MMDVDSLPFDQYQRYRLVADLLGEVAGRSERRLRVLDVGGRTALLRAFVPDADVALVDVDPSSEPGLVLGDGSRLPFATDSFDVVACFDTLEHVPPARRDAFVDECARVARSFVFIAGPYQSAEVDEAEELLQDFMRKKLATEHRYLNEHRQNGLPSRERVVGRLEAQGARTRCFGHGNLERWLVLMCMEMYMDHDPGLRPIAARFFRFYNRALYESDHAEPVYRHVVVAAFGDAALPSGDGLLGPAQAPPGTLPSISELGFELVTFDREKDVWRVEFDRLEGVIGDLEEDLVGHKARLSDTQANLAEHVKENAQLNADLAMHKAERAALEEHLEETQEGARAIQAELLEARQELESMARHIAHLDAVVAQHRAELRDRVGNLKRAFGKKPVF